MMQSRYILLGVAAWAFLVMLFFIRSSPMADTGPNYLQREQLRALKDIADAIRTSNNGSARGGGSPCTPCPCAGRH